MFGPLWEFHKYFDLYVVKNVIPNAETIWKVVFNNCEESLYKYFSLSINLSCLDTGGYTKVSNCY